MNESILSDILGAIVAVALGICGYFVSKDLVPKEDSLKN
jgi:hypothetical protein